MSLVIIDWNFSQLIIPLNSEGFVGLFRGEVSKVRSTREWSEWGFVRLFMIVLKRFGILETNMSRISGRFRGDVGQYVGSCSEMIE